MDHMDDMDDIPDLVEELPPDFTVKPSYLATVTDAHTSTDTSTDAPPVEAKRRIPVTIVTGYLGSGKSTLLDMVGRTSNKRLAIILNEFGDTAAIEKSVTIQDDKNGAVQEWLDLGNGCLCCTVKDNGVVAIENLVESSRDRIDHILLETTGVADPAPIAKMFWLDDALASSVYIDGVVTVVDAANIAKCLEDVGGHWHRAHGHVVSELGVDATPEESAREAQLLHEGLTTAHLQIAVADCILLNKADLVGHDPEAIDAIAARIKHINASSPIYTTSFGDIALDKILDLHAFEASSAKISSSLAATTDLVYHDDRISTVSLDFPFFEAPTSFAQVESFLQKVLWENSVAGRSVEIHRLKGILVCGDDVRVVQGVRDTYEVIENGTLHPDIKQNKLVFIGKDLVKTDLVKELHLFLHV
ncbi:hypothetical protein JCM33374_g6174 [Metschnikowia sp. JCM 33374]|nr:hypothetical protein JCM33374_g6174 [Metschnikowia sp. JCM 33374]